MYEILTLDDLSGEEWREISGCSGRYAVSSRGRIKSFCHRSFKTVGEKILKIPSDTRGRLRVELQVEAGKPQKFFVSNLVLEAFTGPRPEGLVACHEDDCATNNRLENLRWDTQKANIADAFRNGKGWSGEKHGLAKLTDAQVLEMRGSATNDTEYAARFGISVSQIGRARTGKSFKHLPDAEKRKLNPKAQLTLLQVMTMRQTPKKQITTAEFSRRYCVSYAVAWSAREGHTYKSV